MGTIGLKKIGVICFLIFASIFMLISLYGEEEGVLEKEKVIEKKANDFVIHMKVEREKSGIEVHHSLQYIGEGAVEILHQTPLISVSLLDKNHDFTGSLIQKKLNKGNIYYQESKILSPIDVKGECNLYVRAKFLVNNKLVNIDHVEPLMFN
ncbi:hypothetical protein NSA56_17530 [Oceanobacillus caeni]|uniref:YtkA-like domain-containing protein n=2 Tax=Oceanobacillus caeni TaxID=405946 RepID=A0ABR5MF55_9BACI|nr:MULTISPECIES: hypothetical protein [Bacillaceae]KKE79003.1 hypothetical protein WH51_09740 [Bacilli bacterium VT-13-104]PZD83604.1 hypothetical protein DEJ64_14230 [Bacilli bacterium]KPH69228.1 hypothetical protein AFL42_17410 [Oceanobacillus caeni]MBU8791600.1 hypothetical protein [Oceanobacillus caeni]MCR1836140.1 hypothetical protein [Oceanobacillus caeni]